MRAAGASVNAVAAEGAAAGPVDQVILAPSPLSLAEEDQPVATEFDTSTPEAPQPPAQDTLPEEVLAVAPREAVRLTIPEGLLSPRQALVVELLYRQDLLPGGNILAGCAHVLPAVVATADAHPIAVTLDVLLHNDRVRAFRHHGAGLMEPFAAPVERVELESEVVFPRHRLEDANALRHDLVADPVARNDGDAHVV